MENIGGEGVLEMSKVGRYQTTVQQTVSDLLRHLGELKDACILSLDLRFSGQQYVTINDENQILLSYVPSRPLEVTNDVESAVCEGFSAVVRDVLKCRASEVSCSFQQGSFQILFPASKVVQSWIVVSRRLWVLLISFVLRMFIVLCWYRMLY